MAEPTPPTARRLGRYELRGIAGRGGMGVVHRGFDPFLQRDVAVKVIEATAAANPEVRDRFFREARAGAKLRHPGIVAVHEVGTHDGQPFLVMDWVEGESLEALVEKGKKRVTPRRLVQLVREVALALDHAHAQGVLHRDVKPANVLVDRAGRARLTDFGLARDITAGELTATGQVMGTPTFMAPEQAGGRSREQGPATDVYGLGGLLYHGLVGRPPFTGRRAIDVIRKVLFEEPTPPSQRMPRVARELEIVTLKCLAKEPERRYAGPGEVAAELARWRDGEAIVALPPGRIERARVWVRRRPGRAAAVVAALIVLAFGVAWPIAAGRIAAKARRNAAEAEARAAVAAFADTRAMREATPGRRLGAGIDALGAAERLAEQVPGEVARTLTFEAALGLGEVAVEAEQWDVARSAFDRALATDVDDARARAALASVETARTQRRDARRAAVTAILERARSGELHRHPRGRRDAVFALVAERDAETVRVLGEALDEVTAALAAGTDLDPGQRLLARLSCEALGRLGLQDGAVGPLRRHLVASPDGRVAGPPIVALCRLEAHRAAGEVLEMFLRFRRDPSVANAFPHLGRLDPDAVEGAAVVDHVARALVHSSRGESSAALALLDQALACEPENALLRLERAIARQVAGELDGAVEDAERARALDDGSGVQARALFVISGVASLRGELPRAIELRREAVALEPEVALFWAALGEVCIAAGDLAGAADALRKATGLDPDVAANWANLAAALTDLGEATAARAAYARAIAIDERNARAWAGDALLRLMAGDAAGARASAARAVELAPNDPFCWQIRGRARTAQAELVGAVADLRRACALGPDLPGSWDSLGHALWRLGDHGGAEDAHTRAIEVSPRVATFWNNRAVVRRLLGKVDEAIADAEKGVELDPRFAGFYNILGLCLQDAGRLDEALAVFDRGLALEPDHGFLLANRANILYDRRDFAAAAREYRRATVIEPENANHWFNLGNSLYSMGAREDAAASLRRAVAIEPRHAEAWCELGRSLADQGDRSGARAAFDSALRVRPTLAVALARRAAVQDDPARARADIDRALEIAPDSADVLYEVGTQRYGEGDLDGTVEILDRILEARPDTPWARAYRALALRDRGDAAASVRDLDRLVEALPEHAGYRVDRAVSRAAMGDLEGARADAAEARRVGGGDRYVLLRLAELELQHGDLDEGIRLLDRAVATGAAPDPGALVLRAVGRLYRGEPDAALPDADRAVEVFDHFSSRALRGHVRWRAGDRDGALEDLELATAGARHRGEPWGLLALVRLDGDDVEGAVAAADAGLAREPDEPTCLVARALVAVRRGDLDAARADLDAAIDHDPDADRAWRERARLRASGGDRPGAIADLERFVELTRFRLEAAAARRELEELRRGR